MKKPVRILAAGLTASAFFLFAAIGFAANQAKTQRVTFEVGGKGDWAGKAKAALKGSTGVVKSVVDAKGKQAQIEYRTAQTTPQKLARTLSGAGVNARLLLQVEGMH